MSSTGSKSNNCSTEGNPEASEKNFSHGWGVWKIERYVAATCWQDARMTCLPSEPSRFIELKAQEHRNLEAAPKLFITSFLKMRVIEGCVN